MTVDALGLTYRSPDILGLSGWLNMFWVYAVFDHTQVVSHHAVRPRTIKQHPDVLVCSNCSSANVYASISVGH